MANNLNTQHSALNTIFGPVRSRRFGISLGIDLSPALKQCNFDCLYCELAPARTVDVQTETVTVDGVVAAVEAALEEHHDIDVITFTANGEPTLYPYMDELLTRVDTIKGDIQTLILTNSATLTDPSTFNTLLRFDQVKLSLDAVTPEVFKKIDRPHAGIDLAALTDAVIRFSQLYKGRLFIEILFVHGLNDTDEEIAALDAILGQIDCERIDVGTIDRPPAYPVQGLSYSELHTVASKFDAALPVHIASRTHAESCQNRYSDDAIINTLDKRPLTMEDIKLLFDEATQERFRDLLKEGHIAANDVSGIRFYLPAENLHRKRPKNS